MGCTSAKQSSSEEGGQNKSHSNGDLRSDEYRMKGVEGGAGGTEKFGLLGKDQPSGEAGSSDNFQSMHASESQQEFFRILDEKIEKGRDYYSEEEDMT